MRIGNNGNSWTTTCREGGWLGRNGPHQGALPADPMTAAANNSSNSNNQPTSRCLLDGFSNFQIFIFFFLLAVVWRWIINLILRFQQKFRTFQQFH